MESCRQEKEPLSLWVSKIQHTNLYWTPAKKQAHARCLVFSVITHRPRNPWASLKVGLLRESPTCRREDRLDSLTEATQGLPLSTTAFAAQVTHVVFRSHCLGHYLCNCLTLPFSTRWQVLWRKEFHLKIAVMTKIATTVSAICPSVYQYFVCTLFLNLKWNSNSYLI